MKTIEIPATCFFDLMSIAHYSLNITNFPYGDTDFRDNLIKNIRQYLDRGCQMRDYNYISVNCDSAITMPKNKEI